MNSGLGKEEVDGEESIKVILPSSAFTWHYLLSVCVNLIIVPGAFCD